MPDPTTDALEPRAAFAARIAADAGRRLLALRADHSYADPKALGDAGDQVADAYLQGCLQSRYPDDGVLSEETADSAARQARAFTWIVDPLDGTKEFRTGRHDWAVHVGLCRDGVPVLGAVALPAIDRVVVGVCTAGKERVEVLGAGGEWPTAVTAPPPGPLRAVVSRSHTPDWIPRFADALGGLELVPCGSVGFKTAMLLFGRADVYVHKTGLKEWDTCAPEAVARAAGFAVCRLDGSVQRYNRPNPRNDEIVICRPDALPRVLAAVQTVLG